MTRPARVLVVVEQLHRSIPGGIGTAVRGLLQGLAGISHRDTASVTLYASRPSSPGVLGAFGLPVLHSRLPGPLLVRAWDRRMSDVPAGFDVVHSTSFASPPARHARSVVTVHDLTWRQVPEAFPRRGRRWHERAFGRAVRSEAILVTSSAAVAKQLLEAAVASERVRVIPFGCDHLPAPDHEGAERLLKRLGVEDEFLLSVGTIEPRKNLARLFEAYRGARSRLPEPWPLVIVGPSGWGWKVPPVAGVILAGPTDAAILAALYERARLLAYVPLVEGFGLPPVEAMRQGTPVVVSPVPSSVGAAFDVDPLQVGEIEDALVKVSTDDALRVELIRAGRAHVAPLTWESTAEKHLELWSSLGE